MLDMYESIDKCQNVLFKVYGEIKKLDIEEFMMFLGCLTDQYGADKGLTSEQTCEILHITSEVQADVHNCIGMMNPSN